METSSSVGMLSCQIMALTLWHAPRAWRPEGLGRSFQGCHGRRGLGAALERLFGAFFTPMRSCRGFCFYSCTKCLGVIRVHQQDWSPPQSRSPREEEPVCFGRNCRGLLLQKRHKPFQNLLGFEHLIRGSLPEAHGVPHFPALVS